MFKPGDRVVHKSNMKPRKMVVVQYVCEENPPTNIHNEFANITAGVRDTYYCTWISGAKKGGDYFKGAELVLQKP